MIRISVLLVLFAVLLPAFAQIRPNYELITDAGSYLGESSNGDSVSARATANGRFVVFSSSASNLVAEDSNGVHDIFIRDRQTKLTERISLDSNGGQLELSSSSPDISNNGRYVVFTSGRRFSSSTVMLKDRETGQLTTVSQSALGVATTGSAPRISGNGQIVVFVTSSGQILGQYAHAQIVAYNHTNGAMDVLSVAADGALANGDCEQPSVSNNGQVVAFSCEADNLALDVNNRSDVFVVDQSIGALSLVSVSDTGVQGNANSKNVQLAGGGGSLTFISSSTSLSDLAQSNSDQVFFRDLATSNTVLASTNALGFPAETAYAASISDNGSRIGFFAEGNGFYGDRYSGFFTKEMDTGELRSNENISPRAHLIGAGSAVVFDGQSALVEEDYGSFYDVYLQPVSASNPELVSRASAGASFPAALNGDFGRPTLSADGLSVAFDGIGGGLIELPQGTLNYPQLLAVDIGITGADLVSQSASGEPGNQPSYIRDISADGRYVLFETRANNLGPEPDGFSWRLLLADRETGVIMQVFEESSQDDIDAAMSADARYIAFVSTNSDLVSVDVNNVSDVFLLDRATGEVEMISVSSDGIQSNANSYSPAVSGDGRYVVFSSDARTLSLAPNGDQRNLFLRDRTLSTTTQLTLASGGGAPDGSSNSPKISSDGSRISFLSNASNLVTQGPASSFRNLVYLLDRPADQIRLLTRSPSSSIARSAHCDDVDLSSDGNWVAFACMRASLDPSVPIENNFDNHVYRLNLSVGEPMIVALNSAGRAVSSRAPQISADGQQVVFLSKGIGLVGGANQSSQIILADFGNPQQELPLFANGFE